MDPSRVASLLPLSNSHLGNWSSEELKYAQWGSERHCGFTLKLWHRKTQESIPGGKIWECCTEARPLPWVLWQRSRAQPLASWEEPRMGSPERWLTAFATECWGFPFYLQLWASENELNSVRSLNILHMLQCNCFSCDFFFPSLFLFYRACVPAFPWCLDCGWCWLLCLLSEQFCFKKNLYPLGDWMLASCLCPLFEDAVQLWHSGGHLGKPALEHVDTRPHVEESGHLLSGELCQLCW